MSDGKSNQESMKRRLIRAGIAFILGCILSAYAVWLGFGYMGHGPHDSSPWLLLGPGGISIFLFPLVWAAAASEWLPSVIAALIWETLHHAMALKLLLGSSSDAFGPSFFQCMAVYLVSHLTVTAMLILVVLRWLETRRRQKPKSPSTHTFKTRD
jgi:hypothetical protein